MCFLLLLGSISTFKNVYFNLKTNSKWLKCHQFTGAASRCRHTPLYLLPPYFHCHATVFLLPTSSPDRLRMRTTIPFSSCGSNSGWREWEKEKEVILQPDIGYLQAAPTRCSSGAGAVCLRDMVSVEADEGAPRLPVTAWLLITGAHWRQRCGCARG